MEITDKGRREKFILSHLAEHRTAVGQETERLRVELNALTRREAELREEVTALDAILAALPEPPKESEAPSLFAPAPKPVPPTPAEAPKRKRRRKGSRREQLLPAMRAKFGTGTFDTEGVTALLLEAEGGERRKAYFAAWSLVRDLAEDGVISIVSEEGLGPRKKRTYRFVDLASRAEGT